MIQYIFDLFHFNNAFAKLIYNIVSPNKYKSKNSLLKVLMGGCAFPKDKSKLQTK
jgi:hypothetical protein